MTDQPASAPLPPVSFRLDDEMVQLIAHHGAECRKMFETVA